MAKISADELLAVTATPTWRMNAVRLAVEKGLIGQATRHYLPDDLNGLTHYTCVSANEPRDHVLIYGEKGGTVHCDCRAGMNYRPCSHAGAVLLLVTGLAPERVRNAEGFSG